MKQISTMMAIVYDNGKVKKIYDSGKRGTLGLLKFYEKIDTIIDQQKWEKIN